LRDRADAALPEGESFSSIAQRPDRGDRGSRAQTEGLVCRPFARELSQPENPVQFERREDRLDAEHVARDPDDGIAGDAPQYGRGVRDIEFFVFHHGEIGAAHLLDETAALIEVEQGGEKPWPLALCAGRKQGA